MTALFERSGEGIRLTDAGVIYVKYAREIMRAKEEMGRELKRLCSGRRNISIGTDIEYRLYVNSQTCRPLSPESIRTAG